VALVVVQATSFAQVVKAATQTLPIVFIGVGDPVGFGLV
jgi:ABC-type uncharacterized transport system substrate-binding protein